jgi:hypothetical protein
MFRQALRVQSNSASPDHERTARLAMVVGAIRVRPDRVHVTLGKLRAVVDDRIYGQFKATSVAQQIKAALHCI